MRTISNSVFSVSVPDIVAHTDEKFIFTAIRRSQTAASFSISEMGVVYNIYDNDPMIIDLTDYVRSIDTGSVTFNFNALNDSGEVIATAAIPFTLYRGFSTNAEILPLREVEVCGYADTHHTQIKVLEDARVEELVNGTWDMIATLSPGIIFDRELTIGDYRIVYTSSEIQDYEFRIYQTDDECHFANQFPVTWLSENGYIKEYTFRIKNEVRRTLESIELDRPNNGYNVIKAKGINIITQVRGADLQLRQYLADLVYSSEVYTFYLDANDSLIRVPITVSENNTNIDITLGYEDMTFTFNVHQYGIF